MKILVISDTHGRHNELKLAQADVLVHAGDLTNDVGRKSLRDFLIWFEKQDFQYKCFCAGNHDGAFEKWPDLARAMVKEVAPSAIYLENSEVIINGLKFYGSPITPTFYNWYFNKDRGEQIKRYWDMIPSDTDVLITHGPPYGVLDKAMREDFPGAYENAGCKDLLDAIKRVRPKLWVGGHLHHCGGQTQTIDGTIFCNAAVVDDSYNLVRHGVTIEI